MGGASSYYAMLSICGFLTAAWAASKFSRLLGVSSIVLEITTGVVLGPNVLGLIVDEYATCEHSRHLKCEVPANVDAVNLALSGHSISDTLDSFVSHEKCDVHVYADGHGQGGGAHGGGAAHGGSDNHGGGAVPGATHSGGDSHHATNAGGAGHQHRRLSGGGGVTYSSFEECLTKTCEAEIAHECGLTPDVFTLIGHAGVALMIFESGMHFDFEKAQVVGVKACCVAVLGTILPLIVGTLLMMAFGRPLSPDGISAGTALAPTSVGIALRLLGEAGVLQMEFGQAIITAAFVDDILSLVLFNVLFSLSGEFDVFKTVIAPIIGVTFMLIAMVGAVKFWPKVIDEYILTQVPEARDGEATGGGLRARMRLEKDETLFLLQIVMLVVYSLITHLLGTHLWGCFIAGMSFACLQPPHHAHHVWVKQTKRMTSWMIRIFFSCTVAFSIPVGQLISFSAFWKGSILGVFACILTKVCCAPFMGPPRWVIGWAMVGRAEFAYLIAQMALASNMLDEESFSIVIWALLYATIFAPFVFRWLLNRYIRDQGLDTTTGEAAHDDAKVLDEEAHVEKAGIKKADFAAVEDNTARDLDAIDVGSAPKLWSDPPQPVAMGGSKVAPRGRAAVGGKTSGDGFLCCLFFKKIVVQ